MKTPSHKRPCKCKSCDAEFMRLFDGKVRLKPKERKCFCPSCGRVAVTVDAHK